VSAAGGEDIGPFSVKLAVPRPVTWKNRARIGEVDRTARVTVEWKAVRKDDAMLIAAISADPITGDSALCLCMAEGPSSTASKCNGMRATAALAEGCERADKRQKKIACAHQRSLYYRGPKSVRAMMEFP
jgi:hypothetical protein